MQELAEAFRRCRARAVLCILDCCFSGGAPARVLEDSPITRDPGNPLEGLTGNGRILLAASNINEVAYEHPRYRHGVLTYALMEVLRAADDSVSVGVATDRILERVRADAGAIGIIQTPVLLGHVEGGLLLPALRAGDNFYRAFPEARGIRVGPALSDLSVFGLPAEVLNEWDARFRTGLNDLQRRAVNDHRILEGASLLVVAPTSSGKTFIGEMAATRAILEGRKAVFLLPYRALVNEKHEQFQHLYGDRLHMRVVRCTGDYLDQTADVIRGKYDLALLTYEMFLNLAVSNPSLMPAIGLVVLDEAQFITDPRRGISVELLLTYLLAIRERGIEPQLIALSAVIGNINDFDAWLGCASLVTSERPVRLVEGVLDRSGTYQFVDDSGQVKVIQLLPPNAIYQRKEKPGAQDIIVPLVRQLVQQGEQVIVFRNQRGPAQGCANYLAAELGLPPAAEALAALPTHDLSSSSAVLRDCLQGGTAFHNTNLAREEKEVVEQAFRDPSGKVRVLAATTTVAAGINTPASTVILAEQEFIGDDGRAFTVAEYKNMAGRAGRLGFQEAGKAIILADTQGEKQTLFERYVRGRLEELHSSFDPQHLETWMVRLLAQVPRILRRDAVHLLAGSYGGYLANRSDPKWRTAMEQSLEHLLRRMLELGLVEQEGEFIQLTLLGRACGRSALSFQSAMRLVELLRETQPEQLTAPRLVAVLQVLSESDGGYTPLMRKGRKESVWPGEAAKRYGDATVRTLQRFVEDEFDYFARCKRAALLWDWIGGVLMEEIEQRFSATPYQGRIGFGDVRRFADATRFHLRSAHQIVGIMFIGRGPDEESIEQILRQLETGIPADSLALLTLPVDMARGEYLALRNAGVRSPADLWKLDNDAMTRILGKKRAKEIESIRPAQSIPPSPGSTDGQGVPDSLGRVTG
jgi:replicative superfamily II helicase